MHEDELLAWALLGSGGLGLILVYWAVVAMDWCWRQIKGSRQRAVKQRAVGRGQ